MTTPDFCTSCGGYVNPRSKTCETCGKSYKADSAEKSSMESIGSSSLNAAGGNAPINISSYIIDAESYNRESFFKTFASKSSASSIKAFAILTIINAVAGVVIFIGLNGSIGIFEMLESLLLLAAGIVMLKKRGFVIPLLTTLYFILSSVIGMVESGGTFSGFILIMLGIYAVVATAKSSKAFKKYKATGEVPVKEL